MKPEGIVVFHTAGNVGFKKTLDNDGIPKSLASI
jgi:H+/gluconate symporter-like permease